MYVIVVFAVIAQLRTAGQTTLSDPMPGCHCPVPRGETAARTEPGL